LFTLWKDDAGGKFSPFCLSFASICGTSGVNKESYKRIRWGLQFYQLPFICCVE